MARLLSIFNYKCSDITFAYKWTIANYSRLYDEGHPWKWRICSNKFLPPNNEELQFELHLYPKGSKENLKDFVAVGVCALDIPKKHDGRIKCQWNVSIEGENDERCTTVDGKNYLLYCKQWELMHFIDHEQLLNCSCKYLPNDQLTVHFKIHLQAVKQIFNEIKKNEVEGILFDCANKVTRVAHTWTIENVGDLFELSADDGEAKTPIFIQSDYFPLQSERFCLRLCPNGWNADGSDNVDIFIWNDNNNRATVRAKITIPEVNKDDYTREDTWKIPSKYGSHFGLHRRYLLNSDGLIQDNKLQIHCDMSYMMDSTDDNQTVDHTQLPDSVHESESNFDVTLKEVYFVNESIAFTVSDLNLNSSENPNSVDSPIFEVPLDTRYAFQLRLWANGHDEQSKNYLSLDLLNVSQHFRQVTAQYRISILSANGDKWMRWGHQATITRDGSVRRSKFLLQSLIKQYLSDDKLTINCELCVLQDRKARKPKPEIQSQASYPPGTMHISNSNFQNTILNYDAKLRMKDYNSK